MGDVKWGEWRSASECSCGWSFLKVSEVRWIEVDLMNPAAKRWSNTGRVFAAIWTWGISEIVTGANGDITHDAIECRYKCSKCGHTGYYMFGYNVRGKEKGAGRYHLQYKPKAEKNYYGSRTLQYFYDTWESTWPSDRAYSLLYNNCKKFAAEMWSAI